MDRIVLPIFAVASAAITAGALDYVAHNDLGAPNENIRIQALILAAVIGIALVAGSVVRKRGK